MTIAEFSLALERVLKGFRLDAQSPEPIAEPAPRVVESNLCSLMQGAENGCELFFFPRLRDELRAQLRQSPQMLCFQGLRPCVKQLTGSRRWTNRCQTLQDQIVEFLRSCMFQENTGTHCALVVK